MALPARKNIMERAPCGKPPFTLGELKKAIPPHCFNRSLLTSFSYLGYDLLIVALLLYSTTAYYFTGPGLLGWALWFGYWAVQGCALFAIWVIAHECGHHAFSEYSFVDDTVGFIIHSWLLVPYFPWKYSHRRHHSNTGSLERDEAFIPRTKNDMMKCTSTLVSNPPGRLLIIAIYLIVGWPLYLMFNATGRKYPRFACHFDPYSPIYNKRERFQILVSDIALVGVAYTLYLLASAYGFSWVIKVYGIPLWIVNAFVVLITCLQHTHPALPHYDGSEWEWMRGALSTVDRDYGMLNHIFHHITDTHVTHHLFSTIPHYHAGEATGAIKPILGNYYCYDTTPVHNALWREFRECAYVEADTGKSGILWYRRKST